MNNNEINTIEKKENKNNSQANNNDNENNINNPYYFLVYFRIVNGNIDIIINDNTSIKKAKCDELENADKKKNLGKIAHEFNTP